MPIPNTMMQGGQATAVGQPLGMQPQPMAPTPVDPTPIPEEVQEEPITPLPTAEEIKEEEMSYEEKVQYVLSSEEKQKIADYIIQLVDQTKQDRTEWEEIRKEGLDLLEGKRAPKSDPWENCSNISTMSVATHCKLMHAKIFPAIWNENLIHWRPIEKNDIDNTEKVQKFMSWVIRQSMKLQDTIDDIVWDLVVNGTVAIKTRWVTSYRTVAIQEDGDIKYVEQAYQRCVVDNVPIDEVYLPTLWQGVDDSEFIAQDIYNRLPELKDLAKRKIIQGDGVIEKIIPKLNEKVPDSLRMTKETVEGVSPSISAFTDSLPIRQIECYMKWTIEGKLKESVFLIAYESKTYLSGKPLTAVSPMGKRPWIIGQFMQRTGRPYGIGLPELMRGLAKELDAIHNQRIDAGTIGIAPFGFYRAASSFKPDRIQIGPGTMIPVDDTKDVNIIQLNFNPVASFQEERIIIEYMEKLTTTSAYQMGRESDIVKSRATASGTMALISQGEQSFTILGIRVQATASRLLNQILQQYQMWMPDGYADRVLGEKPGELLFPQGMSKLDISGEHDCYMTLDATVGNKAMERQTNVAMVQMGPTLMTLAQDPRGYEMARDFLISIGKVSIEKYLGPKPQQSKSAMPPIGPNMELMGTQPGGPTNG